MMSRLYRDSKLCPGSPIIETAMGRAACHECEMIAQEIALAYADAWTSSDQNFKDAWIATYKMIGGTEEDAVRAEEILSGFRADLFRQLKPTIDEGSAEVGPARIRQAIIRKHKHQSLTGH
jgi:hypothetical protein